MEKSDKKYYVSGFRFPSEIGEMIKQMADDTTRSVNQMLIVCVTYYFKNVFKKDLK